MIRPRAVPRRRRRVPLPCPMTLLSACRPCQFDEPEQAPNAAGPPGVLRLVSFTRGETEERLDVAQSIVVEGVLVMIRHLARGEFPVVVER